MPNRDGTGPNSSGLSGWGQGPCGRGGARRRGGGFGRAAGMGRRGMFQAPAQAVPDKTAELEARVAELEKRLGEKREENK
jgi:hypothetical protein